MELYIIGKVHDDKRLIKRSIYCLHIKKAPCSLFCVCFHSTFDNHLPLSSERFKEIKSLHILGITTFLWMIFKKLYAWTYECHFLFNQFSNEGLGGSFNSILYDIVSAKIGSASVRHAKWIVNAQCLIKVLQHVCGGLTRATFYHDTYIFDQRWSNNWHSFVASHSLGWIPNATTCWLPTPNTDCTQWGKTGAQLLNTLGENWCYCTQSTVGNRSLGDWC